MGEIPDVSGSEAGLPGMEAWMVPEPGGQELASFLGPGDKLYIPLDERTGLLCRSTGALHQCSAFHPWDRAQEKEVTL